MKWFLVMYFAGLGADEEPQLARILSNTYYDDKASCEAASDEVYDIMTALAKKVDYVVMMSVSCQKM